MSEVYHQRARLAALSRYHPDTDPKVVEASLELRTARLAKQIRRLADEAPPLTAEQRTRLAALLTGNGSSHA